MNQTKSCFKLVLKTVRTRNPFSPITEILMMDRTTFVIAHRLSIIRNVTNILVLDKGRIIQQGTHDYLIAEEKVPYKKFYEMQVRENEN